MSVCRSVIRSPDLPCFFEARGDSRPCGPADRAPLSRGQRSNRLTAPSQLNATDTPFQLVIPGSALELQIQGEREVRAALELQIREDRAARELQARAEEAVRTALEQQLMREVAVQAALRAQLQAERD